MPYSCPRLTYAPMGRNYPGAVQFLAISAGDIVSCIRDGTAEADALSKRGPDKQRKQPATKPKTKIKVKGDGQECSSHIKQA